MQRPWGLSGPEFLDLYWIALAVVTAFALLLRVRLRGTRASAPAGAPGLYELAYLSGGPRRAVETSVARLIDTGALRLTRDNTVQVVGSPVPADPVDQAVLADAGRYRKRTLTLLVPSVCEHEAVRALAARLSEVDMLVPPEVAKSKLRLGVAPMALLLVVGVARWVGELLAGVPVGWLTLLLALTGVLIALLGKAAPLTRTAKGSAAVAGARAGEFTGGWRATGSTSDAESVALDGMSAHSDAVLRASMDKPAFPSAGGRRPSRRSAGAAGYTSTGIIHFNDGGHGGGDGGGDGGGSCGGGGCGGGGT
ncbi:uncharacterized protein (TIGR04222 family) [Saccharothrix coeruleofusca]|uniref:TIGR04222 domain-containing membrane protein n=1 Tax=Saccharothrix coeruleofusca TaxID=33919 RepID=UPI001AE8D8B6|nr:TIGR04222 domain-containing membrane protein [Saccharothrix coeruleofusca]MBP2334610.1 uncharacterized protein (TIGR04222 family) [Saccharothrix coeruleofusca]